MKRDWQNNETKATALADALECVINYWVMRGAKWPCSERDRVRLGHIKKLRELRLLDYRRGVCEGRKGVVK